jgi:hypothetical protein
VHDNNNHQQQQQPAMGSLASWAIPQPLNPAYDPEEEAPRRSAAAITKPQPQSYSLSFAFNPQSKAPGPQAAAAAAYNNVSSRQPAADPVHDNHQHHHQQQQQRQQPAMGSLASWAIPQPLNPAQDPEEEAPRRPAAAITKPQPRPYSLSFDFTPKSKAPGPQEAAAAAYSNLSSRQPAADPVQDNHQHQQQQQQPGFGSLASWAIPEPLNPAYDVEEAAPRRPAAAITKPQPQPYSLSFDFSPISKAHGRQEAAAAAAYSNVSSSQQVPAAAPAAAAAGTVGRSHQQQSAAGKGAAGLEVDAWSGADRCRQQQQPLRLRQEISTSPCFEFSIKPPENKAPAAVAADIRASSKQHAPADDDDVPCCPPPNVRDARYRHGQHPDGSWSSFVWTAAGYIWHDQEFKILKDPLIEQQKAAAAAACGGLQALRSRALPAAHLQQTWPGKMRATALTSDWEPAVAMLSALIKMSDHPGAAKIGCLAAAIKGCKDMLLVIRKKRIELYKETERCVTVCDKRPEPLPDADLKAKSKRCREKAAVLDDMIAMYERQLAVLKAKRC